MPAPAPLTSSRRWAERPGYQLLGNLLLRLVSPLLLLLVWELASRSGLLPARIIAAPSTIGLSLIHI